MATHYTPIPAGMGITNTREVFNIRFQELDNAIVALETKGLARSAAPTTLTLDALGSITPTQLWHLVDTAGALSFDILANIAPGVNGQWLILQLANASRIISIEHGNRIWLQNAATINMNTLQQIHLFQYSDTLGKWLEVNPSGLVLNEPLQTSLVSVNQIQMPDRTLVGQTFWQRRLAVQPSWEASNGFALRAAAATVQPIGLAAPTVANSPANANDEDGAFITLPSTTTGNLGGIISTTLNLVQRRWNPVFTCIVKTPSSNFDSLRYWIGLISADVTNVNTIAGATEFTGFRYSADAPDGGWRPVVKDSTTQNVGAAIGSVNANTLYKLRMRIDSASGAVYFSVNDSAETILSTNLPAAGTNLGFIVRCISQTASTRQIIFSRLSVEML